MLNRYFELILRNPLITLFSVLLVLLATGSGVKELSFTSDFRAYFSEKNPELRAFEAMEKRFSRQDNLYFLVSSVDQTLFSEEGLRLVERLTEEA